MDNATFVDNMLDRIKDKIDFMYHVSVFDSMKQHYIQKDDSLMNTHVQSTIHVIKDEIKKIDLRVKDLLDVIDPMWFVVALYHRNKGGLWRDMHKYGVKRDYASSYKVEKPSNGEPVVYTDKFNSEGLPTL